MKYERTDRARHDYSRLTDHEKQRFRAAVALMNETFDQHGNQPIPTWPKQLRIKAIEGAKGVWEMTWNWPDGRATFEYLDLDSGEVAIRWRRIGGHTIFRDP